MPYETYKPLHVVGPLPLFLGIGGLLQRKEQFKGKKVVAVVCGRNIDLEVFKKIIA